MLELDDRALIDSAAGFFERLRMLSFDGTGITRDAFGPRESAAHELVAQYALTAGLGVERDRVGNLNITLRGRDETGTFVATGSHLDSVPCGGNYDGAAGVAAGLFALSTLARNRIVPPKTIKLFALRGEESAWFGTSWIGSRALFGLLTHADLAQPRVDTGRPLCSYLADVGADLAAIRRRDRLLDASQVAAFIEVHIEQGPVLEARRVPLGIVTEIYGTLRHRRIVCQGEAAHAGATPRELRRDAMVGIADLIMRIDRRWAECVERGQQLVVTHGIVGTNPREHAISRVAGEATTSLDIRSDSEAAVDAFHWTVTNEADEVARTRGVRFIFDPPIVNRTAKMDAGWIRRLAGLCEGEGIACARLPSGAGHDSAVFAAAGVPTAMLFVRNRYGSHNAREDMNLEDFAAATRVLTRALASGDWFPGR